MDELMKRTVMNTDDDSFFIDEDSNDVFYRIPGVSNYFLRHDGRIFYHAPYANAEPLVFLSDAIFDTFEEAKAFIEFFGGMSDKMDGLPVGDDTVYQINGLEDKSKTFANLIQYTEKFRKTLLVYDAVIVADKIMENKTVYRVIPRANWGCIDEPSENHLTMDLTRVHTAVLKPIEGIQDMYYITGGSKRAMVQVSFVKSEISKNQVLRFAYHKIDKKCIAALGDYRYNSVDEIVRALKIWEATDVMHYTEAIKKADGTEVEQNFIRYFDADDIEHTLMILLPNPKFKDFDKAVMVYELVKA